MKKKGGRELDLSSLRILLVEDSLTMRLLIKQHLLGLGATHITEAPEGGAALEMLETVSVNIIITDLKMAPVNGIEFVRRLRALEDNPNSKVPTILITGHLTSQNVTRAREAGFNGFLSKPVSAGRILGCIEKALA